MGTSEVGLNAFCVMTWLQPYGGQGVERGDLNKNGLNRPIGIGIIRMCDLSGIGVTFGGSVSL